MTYLPGKMNLSRFEGGPRNLPDRQPVGKLEPQQDAPQSASAVECYLTHPDKEPFLVDTKTGRSVHIDWNDLAVLAFWKGIAGFICFECNCEGRPDMDGNPPARWEFFADPGGWLCWDCLRKMREGSPEADGEEKKPVTH